MSAARWSREFGGLALSLLGSTLGWLVIAPLAALVPKRNDWVAVIGRQHGKFLDNAKYFFLLAPSFAPDLRLAFITERPEATAALSLASREALDYPGPRAIWFLLRCGSVVADSTDWGRHLRRFLLIRARTLQLWHGVGFKRIEIDKWRNETGRYRWFSRPWVFSLRMVFYRITGRLVRYDAVAVTSRFYRDQVFAPAFLSDRFLLSGYPRNTFGRGDPHVEALAWSNVESTVARRAHDWRQQGRKLVLVAPTMRDSGAPPMDLDPAAVQAIDAFAEANNVEFVFKFHPSERAATGIAGRHVHRCHADSDIYPLFPLSDALVTDYSSVYMDYLLVDRPVLFLVPRDDGYLQNDRQIQFDLARMTPGPAVATWEDLLSALAQQWQQDSYAPERRALRQKAFDDRPQERAVPDMLAFMRDAGWLPASPAPMEA